MQMVLNLIYQSIIWITKGDRRQRAMGSVMGNIRDESGTSSWDHETRPEVDKWLLGSLTQFLSDSNSLSAHSSSSERLLSPEQINHAPAQNTFFPMAICNSSSSYCPFSPPFFSLRSAWWPTHFNTFHSSKRSITNFIWLYINLILWF